MILVNNYLIKFIIDDKILNLLLDNNLNIIILLSQLIYQNMKLLNNFLVNIFFECNFINMFNNKFFVNR